MLARNYAGVLGLLAFATMLARGLFRGAGVEATVGPAWLALWAAAAAGWTIGWLAEGIVTQSVAGRLAAEMAAHEAPAQGQVERRRLRAAPPG